MVFRLKTIRSSVGLQTACPPCRLGTCQPPQAREYINRQCASCWVYFCGKPGVMQWVSLKGHPEPALPARPAQQFVDRDLPHIRNKESGGRGCGRQELRDPSKWQQPWISSAAIQVTKNSK